MIAGLLPPDGGRVLWDGEDITAVPAHRRRIGLVFQDHQLFPHRDVAGNVGFGLAVAGRPKAEIRERVGELLHLVGLDGLRAPGRRVAVRRGGTARRAGPPSPQSPGCSCSTNRSARSIGSSTTGWPSTSGTCCSELGTAGLHVTHDRDEAAMVADRIVTVDELHGR